MGRRMTITIIRKPSPGLSYPGCEDCLTDSPEEKQASDLVTEYGKYQIAFLEKAGADNDLLCKLVVLSNFVTSN